MPTANAHIVVIGGTSALGLSIAQSAYPQGCKVTTAGRGAERAAEIAKSIGPGTTGVHIDLEDSASIKSALGEGPPVDHVVITSIMRLATSVKDFAAEDAQRLARIKLVGYIEAISAVLPRLKPTSSIVLFAGLSKANPYPGSTMISVVNGGIVGMTKTMAVELAPIRVNCISPGLVPDSPTWQTILAKGSNPVVDAFTAKTPSGQLAMTADIVEGVFALLDNKALNGIDLEIDGGIQLV
ncbi:MAG: SDR family oxidoreductase [Pseudolabrys sp.]|nr:SDR family oxidoreductase [Pseudolabrys sp.]